MCLRKTDQQTPLGRRTIQIYLTSITTQSLHKPIVEAFEAKKEVGPNCSFWFAIPFCSNNFGHKIENLRVFGFLWGGPHLHVFSMEGKPVCPSDSIVGHAEAVDARKK